MYPLASDMPPPTAGGMNNPNGLGIDPQMLMALLGQADQPLQVAQSARGMPGPGLGLLQSALLGQATEGMGEPAPDDIGVLLQMIRQLGQPQGGMMPGMGAGMMPQQQMMMPPRMGMGGPPGY